MSTTPSLPAELWLEIFSRLTYPDLKSLPLVCTLFSTLISSPSTTLDPLLFRSTPSPQDDPKNSTLHPFLSNGFLAHLGWRDRQNRIHVILHGSEPRRDDGTYEIEHAYLRFFTGKQSKLRKVYHENATTPPIHAVTVRSERTRKVENVHIWSDETTKPLTVRAVALARVVALYRLSSAKMAWFNGARGFGRKDEVAALRWLSARRKNMREEGEEGEWEEFDREIDEMEDEIERDSGGGFEKRVHGRSGGNVGANVKAFTTLSGGHYEL